MTNPKSSNLEKAVFHERMGVPVTKALLDRLLEISVTVG